MATYYSPQIVTNGITFCVDAGNTRSYGGSGSTWSSLISTDNNATLVNTPTYSANNRGYLTFNGSTQYATVAGTPLNTTAYTKSVWCMFNATADNNLASSSDSGHFMFTGSTSKLYCGHSSWSGFPTTYPSTANISNSVWYNFTLTFNTTDGMVLYINGVQDSTYTTQKTAPSGGALNLGSYAAGGNLLNGRLSNVTLYNRVLTAAEVAQNFNALRGRYAI